MTLFSSLLSLKKESQDQIVMVTTETDNFQAKMYQFLLKTSKILEQNLFSHEMIKFTYVE